MDDPMTKASSSWIFQKAAQETADLNRAAETLQFRYGGPFPVSGHHLFKRDREMVAARSSGKSVSAIGRTYGISHQRVYMILKRMAMIAAAEECRKP